MAQTSISDVSDQIQSFWSPMFIEELKQNTILPSLVNKTYSGELKQKGDTVHVSMMSVPTAERKTVGAGHDSFNPSKLQTTRVSIKADQRISASVEFDDLVSLQSQIGDKDSEIRQGLIEAVEIELNNYLYSQIAPSAATPAHVLTGVADFNAAQLNIVRTLAAQAKWRKDKGWWLLADPNYVSDMLNNTTLVSADFGASDAPVIGGQIAKQRFGFNILEDNSDGLISLSATSADAAIAFHPDFMGLVMQQEPRFKVSDLHANKQFGYVLSVDILCGSALLPEGASKHVSIINA